MFEFRRSILASPGGYEGLSPKKKVAFVLAGCGARDGSEITEAVSAMIAFSQAGYAVSFFAPARNTYHVVNHSSGEIVQNAERSMLDEANRIARGCVNSLSSLNPNHFDVLAFSGGFGVAKNLCDFAFKGAIATLAADVQELIFSFMGQKKVVCAMCIAPVLLGMAARDKGVKGARLTLGPNAQIDAVAALRSWGAEVVLCASGEACTDERNRFVTVPAYMVDTASPADIFMCAQAMVAGVGQLLGAS